MGITWITPINITPDTLDAWIDVDISAIVPAGTTGVLLHVLNTGSTGKYWGCRNNGSTDNRAPVKALAATSHLWASCGVDANRV